MGVRMAGVVMIDRDPVELRAKVGLHLPHQVAGEPAQVAHLDGILRRDDEAELVAVLPSALDEGAAVRFVLDGRIGTALLAVARHSVAFEIAQMGVGRLARRAAHLRAARAALRVELDHPRLDDDPARPEPRAAPVPAPSAAVFRKGSHHLRAPAMRIESPAAFSFPAACRSRSTADPIGVAAGLADGHLDLLQERQITRTDTRSPRAGAPRPDAEIVSVVACHDRTIGIGFAVRKCSQALIVIWRKNDCCSVETAERTSQRHCAFSILIKLIAKRAALSTHRTVPQECRCREAKTMCRQPLATEGSAD